jgi:branched-chain amino acid transport system substrate-binding protein
MVLRQIKMLGLKQPVVASSAAFVPAAMQLLSASDLDNVWGVIDTYLPATDKGKNYAERFKQRFSMDADPYGAAYYDGAMLMAQAINAVRRRSAKAPGLSQDLKGYQGVSHVYSFDAKGNGVHDVAIVKFAKGGKDMQFISTIKVD